MTNGARSDSPVGTVRYRRLHKSWHVDGLGIPPGSVAYIVEDGVTDDEIGIIWRETSSRWGWIRYWRRGGSNAVRGSGQSRRKAALALVATLPRRQQDRCRVP